MSSGCAGCAGVWLAGGVNVRAVVAGAAIVVAGGTEVLVTGGAATLSATRLRVTGSVVVATAPHCGRGMASAFSVGSRNQEWKNSLPRGLLCRGVGGRDKTEQKAASYPGKTPHVSHHAHPLLLRSAARRHRAFQARTTLSEKAEGFGSFISKELTGPGFYVR